MNLTLSSTRKVLPKKGKILLAEPFMDDPNFKRSVILLCEHSSNGSFGFVLNNYIDLRVNEIIAGVTHLNSRISLGGPVHSNYLYFLHRLGSRIPESIEVIDGLYIGGSFDALVDAIEEGGVTDRDVRFFQGCSGWGDNQLDMEMKCNSWLVVDGDVDILMNTEVDDLWKDLMSGIGPKERVLSKMTADPSLN